MPFASREAKQRYQREWRARRRSAFFAGHACERCGTRERLELHHRDPSQKVGHAIWSWSESRRQAELAKCIVLCRDCHAEHHRAAVSVRSRFLIAALARDASGRLLPREESA